ncbi:hypothetical protein OIU79_005128 [Salix purpurea]|uniref:Uncharacterized protein n=1 Tax=Salix purpurea TaxID=77065 RepID=A0A9Q0UBZ4_SALPP|nr:hypothetical protein OIU79_005128 [Salix purpurea]
MDRSFKRTRDDRDRDHYKHRSRDDKLRDSPDSHHHRSESESHQRDHHKSSRRDDTKLERSHEGEESADRRERSHDHKSSSSSRREEREGTYDAREEREGSRERKREKRERETAEEDHLKRKKRKDRGGGEDRVVVEKEKRNRRRFGEKVKEEDNMTDNNNNVNSFENVKRMDSSEAGVKEEVNDEPIGHGRGSTTENGGLWTTNMDWEWDFLRYHACFCWLVMAEYGVHDGGDMRMEVLYWEICFDDQYLCIVRNRKFIDYLAHVDIYMFQVAWFCRKSRGHISDKSESWHFGGT